MNKYKLKLTGTVSDGTHTQEFTEKNVTYIEFEFGDKKIEIGKKSLEKEIKQLKEANNINANIKAFYEQWHFILDENQTLKQKLEKINKFISSTEVYLKTNHVKIHAFLSELKEMLKESK